MFCKISRKARRRSCCFRFYIVHPCVYKFLSSENIPHEAFHSETKREPTVPASAQVTETPSLMAGPLETHSAFCQEANGPRLTRPPSAPCGLRSGALRGRWIGQTAAVGGGVAEIRGDGPRRGRLQRAPSAAPAQIGLLARSSGQHQAPDRWARSEVCAVGYLMALPFPSSRCSSVTTVSSKPLAEAKHHSFSSQVISLFSVKEVISGEDIRQRLGQQPPRMGRRTRPQTLGSPELTLVSGRPELSLAPGSQAGAILSDDRCAAFFLLLLLDRSALRSSHRFIVRHYVTGGPSCPSL